jgi:hypothetical protein
LKSKRNGKKSSAVTGDVQLQFTLLDLINPTATPQQVLQKLGMICGGNNSPDADEAEDERLERFESGEQDDDDEDQEGITDEADDGKTPSDKKKKRLRLARLKKKAKEHGYEFAGATDVAGVLFVEIQRITDLPPEKNGRLIAIFCRISKLMHFSSTPYWLRYGPFRGHLPWKEDIPNPRYTSQPQSCVRRKTGLPGHETRASLLFKFLCGGPRQAFWE